MDKVYVVQDQKTMRNGVLVPKFDLSSAEQFGEISFLLSSTAKPFTPEPIIDELYEKLAAYKSSDSILLVGNPMIIGFTVAVAADITGGEVSLLQWSGKHKSYIRVKATIIEKEKIDG